MRIYLLLAAIAAPLFFANLGGTHLWDVDEAIFSQAGKEMYQRGDWVVPYFNGEIFPDKPAMMYWLMISAYELFGPNEFAARFWSAVFGVGSVLLTYRLGRLMFSPATGFWAGIALASSLNYNVIARAATPDSFLVFFSTLAVLLFVEGTSKARAQSGTANELNAPWAGQTHFEPSWRTYALCYAAMAGGVLTKGPVGVVLPTAVIGLFLLLMRAESPELLAARGLRAWLTNLGRFAASVFAPSHFLRTVWSMRPLTAMAVVLAVAGPWYVMVGIQTAGAWPRGFFGVHNFGRFLNAMENHRGPIFYYLLAISVGFFPWSVLFAPTLLDLKRQLAGRCPGKPGYVLACSWLAVWVGFFSLAGTKLPSYVLPAYPALALLTGCFVARWIREPAALSRFWSRMAWGTVALTGIGMIVGLSIAAHLYLHDDWILAGLGAIPLVAAAFGFLYSQRGDARAAATTLAVGGAALSLAMFAVAGPYVDRYQESPALAAQIRQSANGESTAVANFHFFRPSLVFYTGRPVAKTETPEQARQFFDEHPDSAFLVTTAERMTALAPLLPDDVGVVSSHPRFLRAGTLLLLGRRQSAPTTANISPGQEATSRQ